MKNLEHTYHEAMDRIDGQSVEDRQLGLLALTWVANAKRSLSVSELREALAVDADSTFLDTDNLLDMDIILAVCAGLITIGTHRDVRLIHYTTQDYLDSIQPDRFPLAHTIIVSTCLKYLSFTEFDDPSESLETHHPLLGYAEYCLMHVPGQPEIELQERIIDFLVHAS